MEDFIIASAKTRVKVMVVWQEPRSVCSALSKNSCTGDKTIRAFQNVTTSVTEAKKDNLNISFSYKDVKDTER